jgi:hypothetical protein
VKRFLLIGAVLGCALSAAAAHAQQPWSESFFAHNAAMTRIQPSWPTPLVETEPRLTQYYRFAFSNQYTAAGTETVSYGDARGGGIVAWSRCEFSLLPPSYIQHNSKAADGFGDTTALVKFRIASENAEAGNFIATAFLGHTFPTGSHSNGAVTGSWNPTLAGGIGLGRRFDVETSLGGALPTGKIAEQGRTIAWSALAQGHLTRAFWLETENNASFYFAGSHDGKMQNFITPAAFFIPRRSAWKPAHPFVVFAAGMQIATSGFHTYNHKAIAEMRVLF